MIERNFTKIYEASLSRKQKHCFYSSLLKELLISESYSDINKVFYIYHLAIYLSTIYYLGLLSTYLFFNR